MIKQTLGEWQSEMKRIFNSSDEVAFVCPACGRISTIKDHVDAGGVADDAPRGCIGRTNKKGSSNGKDQGFGCNWAAYGLLGTLGKGRTIVFPDGHESEVFDFAPAEVLSNA